VWRAGLKSHPQHELAKRQMRGYSGMITFYIKGGEAEARKFLSTLKVGDRLTSTDDVARIELSFKNMLSFWPV
jgi:cystathionine beta-lyase/cystathionine gamma-synthase